MVACLLMPITYCSFIQFEGGHNCLRRTAIGQERRYLHKEVIWFLDAIHGCPAAFTEGLPAAPAAVALLFPTMYLDVATANLAAGVTSRIRAELFLRVHLSTPLLDNKSVSENPLFSNHAILWCYPRK